MKTINELKMYLSIILPSFYSFKTHCNILYIITLSYIVFIVLQTYCYHVCMLVCKYVNFVIGSDPFKMFINK